MKKFIATIAIIVVLICLAVYAYVRKGESAGGGGGGGGSGRDVVSVPVEVVQVLNGNIISKIEASGTVKALAEVEVYPKQTGELVELLVDKGDRVKPGQALGKIDSRLFEIQKKQAQAELVIATAAYDKMLPMAFVSSETSFKQAKSNLDRLQSMLEQAELDLQLQEKQADIQVKKANADLRIAEARLQAAESGARDQELAQAKVRTDNAKRELDRLTALSKEEMVSQDQVEAAQLQYDIYKAQLSLLEEGLRPEDMEVLKAQVETAKASLESAESNRLLVSVKRSSLDAAKAQVASAQAGFDEASVAKDAFTWEKDLTQAKASVQKAEAALELAQQRLDESIIEAPIGGIIAARLLDRGDTASTNRSLFTIVDMDVVKIEANVFARDIVEVKVGDPVAIKPDIYPGETFPGTVTNISPVIDRASQTVVVEIEAANSGYKLKPGMFTPVEMMTREHKDVPIISVDALVKKEDEIFVYVVDDGKAAAKKIDIGINDGVRAEIVSGLKAGDEYIMAGRYSLRPGMSISLAGQQRQPGGPPVGQQTGGR